ncbi:hypothetical protein BE21_28375 [Sorangium cellulosum]|uniref:Uncharacterized protein n=1 Tax=Sorangium cellulosum TaxID=56 RepID=A0A150TSH2_SORCE|nr:hypothetical protein BE21_28375 [Sorangium cellulosum]
MSVVKAAPSFFYYAMADGTSAVDSEAFGKLLDAKGGATGWRNLLDLLDQDPAEPGRLVDPKHDFLPIYKLKRAGSLAAKDPKGIACICPGGLNGLGQDAMWQSFRGGAAVDFPEFKGTSYEKLVGRHAGAELSAKFLSEFMLDPVVEVDGARKQIVSGASAGAKGTLFRASLLYMSSHGWLGGFARGDMNPGHPGALPLPTAGIVDDPRQRYLPFNAYFVVGRFDVAGRAFRGPEWIVLAQCSTLNNTTWAMWARVMARSAPQVRGILGYEEASPAAVSSIPIATSFFTHLKSKKTFYEAWKAANTGQNWAALVHEDAMGDTLDGWAARKALGGKDLSSYLGSASRAAKQVKIVDPPPPYRVRVFHKLSAAKGGSTFEITPDVLDRMRAWLLDESEYRVEITHLAGGKISQVKVQWIHIRDTFKQFDLKTIFSSHSALGASVSTKNPKVLVADLAVPATTVEVIFTAKDKNGLGASGLAPDHSYLWPRVHATGDGLADQQYDVKARGLAYNGV